MQLLHDPNGLREFRYLCEDLQTDIQEIGKDKKKHVDYMESSLKIMEEVGGDKVKQWEKDCKTQEQRELQIAELYSKIDELQDEFDKTLVDMGKPKTMMVTRRKRRPVLQKDEPVSLQAVRGGYKIPGLVGAETFESQCRVKGLDDGDVTKLRYLAFSELESEITSDYEQRTRQHFQEFMIEKKVKFTRIQEGVTTTSAGSRQNGAPEINFDPVPEEDLNY